MFSLYFTAKVLMVSGCERAANDVINICTCQFQSCQIQVLQLFSMHLPKVHVSEFISQLQVCFQVMSLVNSKCKISK